jgi:hypothetical protein
MLAASLDSPTGVVRGPVRTDWWQPSSSAVLPVASARGVFRRQCFRRRASASRRIVEFETVSPA